MSATIQTQHDHMHADDSPNFTDEEIDKLNALGFFKTEDGWKHVLINKTFDLSACTLEGVIRKVWVEALARGKREKAEEVKSALHVDDNEPDWSSL